MFADLARLYHSFGHFLYQLALILAGLITFDLIIVILVWAAVIAHSYLANRRPRAKLYRLNTPKKPRRRRPGYRSRAYQAPNPVGGGWN